MEDDVVSASMDEEIRELSLSHTFGNNERLENLLKRKYSLHERIKVTNTKIFVHITDLVHFTGSNLLYWSSWSSKEPGYHIFGRLLDSYKNEDEIIWKML